MSMEKYKIGFWNYVETGILDNQEAVDDWQELGFNLVMSFEFNPQKHDKNEVLDLLDRAFKKGMQVIICDARTNFRTLKKKGKETFREEVRQAYYDFGQHPAAFGFHIGDEPLKDEVQVCIEAYNIVKQEMPKLTPFVNLFPYFIDDSFEQTVGCKKEDYQGQIEDFLKQTSAPILSYDCYSQCAIFDREIYLEMYFKNLEIFSRACKKYKTTLYTCLLSVGHWAYRVPTADDIRWQLNTAIAHGVKGVLWFFVYERELDGSYRYAPIDCFDKRTIMFDYLARENNIFRHYYEDIFNSYRFVWVKHFLKTSDGFPLFITDQIITKIEVVINPEPFAISRFENHDKIMYMVTNLSQDKPSCLKLHFAKEHEMNNTNIWFAPGGMEIFEFDK